MKTKTESKKYWWECAKLEPWKTASGNGKWCSLCGKQFGSPSKKGTRDLLYNSAILILCIYWKELKTGYWILYTNVKWYIIHKSWKVETSQVTIKDEWKSKMWYIHTMHIIQPYKRMQFWYMLQHGWISKTSCQMKLIRHKGHIVVWLHLDEIFRIS